jgi:phosphoenolpyruvate carboxykinase (GTP)
VALQQGEVHRAFPGDARDLVYGSGYGGNALLGKKCFALRIASNIARDEGWMAEHMLILGVEIRRAKRPMWPRRFPSACGKTNFAMLVPPEGLRRLEGLDGRRRHRLDQAGRERPLRAINPEAGFFGVAPGTSVKTNPNAMATLARNTIFTNVALTPEGGVWWEGMTDEPPAECLDWQGKRWTPEIAKGDRRQGRASQRPLHAPASQCPTIDPAGRSERRAHQRHHLRRPPRHHHAAGLPGLQLERRRLHRRHHGLGDHGRRRRRGRQGAPRSHGHAALLRLSHGRLFPALDQDAALALSETPRIFHVNWFRKDADGKFLWPGFSENMRVLKWIVDRAHGRAQGKETPIGWMPHYEDIEWNRARFSAREVR